MTAKHPYPTVAVDCDGTLHSYVSGWQGELSFDPPEPGALEFIHELIRRGYTPVVFTTRAATPAGRESH